MEKANKKDSNANANDEEREEKSRAEKLRKKLVARHAVFQKLYFFIKSSPTQTFLYFTVITNILILCLDTYKELKYEYGKLFLTIENICVFVFLIEFLINISIWRTSYFFDFWNLLDFVTLLIGILDGFLMLVEPRLTTSGFIDENLSGANNATLTANNGLIVQKNMSQFSRLLRVMRVFRALRVLRTVKILSSLQVLLRTCANSFQSLGAIILLMTLFLYIFAVIACGLFHKIHDVHFGSIFKSIFTLFQIITLDDWFNLYNTHKIKINDLRRNFTSSFLYHNQTSNTNLTLNNSLHDWELKGLSIFLFVYLIIEHYIMLNLFLAVLVDNFHLAMQNFKIKKDNLFIANLKTNTSRIQSEDIENNSVLSKLSNIRGPKSAFIYSFVEDVDRKTVSNDLHYLSPNVTSLNPNQNNNNNGNINEKDENETVNNQNEIEAEKFEDEDDGDDDDISMDNIQNFINNSMSKKERKLVERHFQLLNSIEYYMQDAQELFRILEHLIEITADENDEFF